MQLIGCSVLQHLGLSDVQSFKKIHHDSVGLPILQFFERFSAHFPTWASFAEDVFILSPTSAAVERLFSLLRDKFDDKSKQSLIDYITASLMLRGNKRALKLLGVFVVNTCADMPFLSVS